MKKEISVCFEKSIKSINALLETSYKNRYPYIVLFDYIIKLMKV